MQRLCSLLSILILASILAGCAGSANTPSEQIQAMESNKAPTNVPIESVSIDSGQPEVLPHEPPESCPITKAPDVPFTPPEPYPSKPPERYTNQFWYGTPELWTMLSTDATWNGLPKDRYGYSEKVFWWSHDFNVAEDPYPAFTVTIQRLDSGAQEAPIVVAEKATNASADFGTAMLTGVTIPEPGCWKITGLYKQAKLSFLIWVAP